MTDKKTVVILGGGIGGLAVGYYLAQTNNYEVVVLEKEPVIGGLSASFRSQGFTLDYGAHKLYSTLPGIMDEMLKLFAGDLLRLPKRNKIYLRHNLLAYPLKLSNLTRVLGFPELLKLGLGFIWESLKGLFSRNPARTYEDYMIKRFGRPAYGLVFEPLADKVWGDPATLHADMARTRVPSSGAFEVVLKLLGLKKETAETNAEYFLYPHQGFGAFPQKLRQGIEQAGGRVISGAGITALTAEQDRITGVQAVISGRTETLPCDYLVSTIPLASFAPLLEITGGQELENRNLVLVYLFIDRPLALNDQWIFFPEREYVFSRIFEQKQMSPDLGPADQTALCCDFTCAADSWQWQATDQALAEKCIEGLVRSGFVTRAEIKGSLVKRFPGFYPRYGLDYNEKLDRLISQIKRNSNLLLSGRVGMYNYNNCDHCLDMALFIKEQLARGIEAPDIIDNLLRHVKEYKIVD